MYHYGAYPYGYSTFFYYSYPIGRFPMTTDSSDVKRLQQSASQFVSPVQQLQQLLQVIAANPSFAKQLKTSASLNQNDEVKRLIRESGVSAPFHVGYSPDGIRITLEPPSPGACFEVRAALCW